MSEPALCVLHEQDDPAETWIGNLCKRHRRRMDDLTSEIGLLLVDACRIIDGGAPAELRPRTRRLKEAEAAAPADLALLALLDRRTRITHVKATTLGETDRSTPTMPILAVIASWLLLVAEERPLKEKLPQSALAQLDLLARHHDWLAATLYVDDYLAELTDLLRHLRDVTNDHTHHRVATCDLPTEDGQIPALIIRRNRALRVVLICGGAVLCANGDDVWRCKRCGSTWITDQQKARFGVRSVA